MIIALGASACSTTGGTWLPPHADAAVPLDAGVPESGLNDAGTANYVTFPDDAPTAQDGGRRVTQDGGTASDAGASNHDASDARVTKSVHRIAVRVHVGQSRLAVTEITDALAQLNDIWLSQASVCFEFEVTLDEADAADGLDVRLLEGGIMNYPFVNGLTLGAHEIYVVDHPTLFAAPNPVQNFTGRTLAHEFGHIFGLLHENPPDDPDFDDCMEPCVCTASSVPCDDFLMRSHHQGYFLSATEVELSRAHAAELSLADHAPVACGAPIFDNDAGRSRQ